MCRRQRSTPFRLADGPKIFTEFLYSVVDRNPAFRQQRLKGELTHLRKAARLRQREPLFLEQGQCKFLLKLALADMSRREDFI